MVAISIVVTFIITLVITALITHIITSMYHKSLIDHIRRSVISQQGDPHGDIRKHDPAYAIATMSSHIGTL